MPDRIPTRRRVLSLAASAALASAWGCESQNPNAQGIEAPILGPDTPRSSEEAARQSEPEPIQYKTRRPR